MEIKEITPKAKPTITLIVQGPPVAWHRAGRNRFTGMTFMVKADKVWQSHVRTQAILHRPRIMPIGAVVLDITFWMPRPKKHKPGSAYYHTKKPDLDNLVKNIKDAMSKSMYKDDSQVVQENLKKIYVPHGANPGVIITLIYLEDDIPTIAKIDLPNILPI